jgi:hypothetical protein
MQRDPIFELIDRHKKANKEFRAALILQLSSDPESGRRYSQIADRALKNLSTTTPKTLVGLYALLTYVVDVWNGKFSSNGKPDRTFTEADVENIVRGALECLHVHLEPRRRA